MKMENIYYQNILIKKQKIYKELSNDSSFSLEIRDKIRLANLQSAHGDYDHIGEAINLVNNFKVDKVIFNC